MKNQLRAVCSRSFFDHSQYIHKFCTTVLKSVKRFIKEWFDYSERRMIDNIRRMPKAKLVNKGKSDPLEGILPGGGTALLRCVSRGFGLQGSTSLT